MVASADTQVNRERHHLSYCPRVDPKLSRRFPSAQVAAGRRQPEGSFGCKAQLFWICHACVSIADQSE
jgi:hypothetical protein